MRTSSSSPHRSCGRVTGTCAACVQTLSERGMSPIVYGAPCSKWSAREHSLRGSWSWRTDRRKTQFGHTQFVLDTTWAQSESMQHLVNATQAALTKILPGEEDRFGE
jgi:hypothetical protein